MFGIVSRKLIRLTPSPAKTTAVMEYLARKVMIQRPRTGK